MESPDDYKYNINRRCLGRSDDELHWYDWIGVILAAGAIGSVLFMMFKILETAWRGR